MLFFLLFCGGSTKFELSTFLKEELCARVKIEERDVPASTLPTAAPSAGPGTGTGTVGKDGEALDRAIELMTLTLLGKKTRFFVRRASCYIVMKSVCCISRG